MQNTLHGKSIEILSSSEEEDSEEEESETESDDGMCWVTTGSSKIAFFITEFTKFPFELHGIRQLLVIF